MAEEHEEKPNVGPNARPRGWAILALRFVAFLATTAATLVMALNKETKSLVVATIGTTPIKATLTAKFQDTPAFMYDPLNIPSSILSSVIVMYICFSHHDHLIHS